MHYSPDSGHEAGLHRGGAESFRGRAQRQRGGAEETSGGAAAGAGHPEGEGQSSGGSAQGVPAGDDLTPVLSSFNSYVFALFGSFNWI